MSPKHKIYPVEFRIKVASEFVFTPKSLDQIATEFHVAPNSIARWKTKYASVISQNHTPK